MLFPYPVTSVLSNLRSSFDHYRYPPRPFFPTARCSCVALRIIPFLFVRIPVASLALPLGKFASSSLFFHFRIISPLRLPFRNGCAESYCFFPFRGTSLPSRIRHFHPQTGRAPSHTDIGCCRLGRSSGNVSYIRADLAQLF